MRRRRLLLALLAIAIVLLFAAVAAARVGGGESYSGGGGSGGGGGGGGGGEIVYLVIRGLLWLTINYPAVGIPVDIVVISGVVIYVRRNRSGKLTTQLVQFSAATVVPRATTKMDALRKFDPNFSEITFADFCYSLYARAHNARGDGKLDQFSPYLSAAARQSLNSRNPKGLKSVSGVIVGSFNVIAFQGIETPKVQVTVGFESNYTEVFQGTGGQQEICWYVREQWALERNRDILSPPPQKVKADHCPKCGAPLQTRSDGACNFCGAKIESGAFQWYVTNVTLISMQDRGPRVTAPEQGTGRMTVMQPNFMQAKAEFEAAHPDFRWQDFDARAKKIAVDLNTAWSSGAWDGARSLETDNLFQMHRYWMDNYSRQGLRNVVDNYTAVRVDPVKISTDAFYEAITARMWAHGADYTIDGKGAVVLGERNAVRQWSEYWTFIRTRSQGSTGKVTCPNCGAEVEVGSSGVCSFCGGKLQAGSFDWVLSRIEQDESYAG